MKCIVCGKELVQLEPTDIEPAKGMWDGAGVMNIRDAADAYDKAARKHFGPFAYQNKAPR